MTTAAVKDLVNKARPIARGPEQEPAQQQLDGQAAERQMRPRKQRRPRADTAVEQFLMSEDALALDFVAKHGHEFRWSPGMDWMHNEGDHWARDTCLRRYDLARLVARAAGTNSGDDKAAARYGSAKTVGAIVSLAQSDPRIVVPANAWDENLWALNTPDGVVDLRTGMIRGRGDELHTQVTRIGPRADMPCPTWERFLEDVFVGDADLIVFMQRLLGYMLTGLTLEQKLFFWYGLGANGKSTLLDIVLWITGTYGLKLPATALMQTSMERHPTELAQLQGKRLAVSSELDEGLHWAESRIKELTGDEELTARFMRQDFFTFRQTQKHVIVGNYKPRMRGGDAALARRFVLVPFKAKFEGKRRDTGMLEKLRAEAPAILAWMLRGAMDWADSGLAIPASIATASAEYMADNDDVAQWLLECCERHPDVSTKSSELYESFKHWIKSRGQHAPAQRTWGERMAIAPGITKKQSNGFRYVGVRLNADESNRALNYQRDGAW